MRAVNWFDRSQRSSILDEMSVHWRRAWVKQSTRSSRPLPRLSARAVTRHDRRSDDQSENRPRGDYLRLSLCCCESRRPEFSYLSLPDALFQLGAMRGHPWNAQSADVRAGEVDTAFGSAGYGFALFFAAATMVRTSDHVPGWAASTASMSARGCLISHGNVWSVRPS